jgi:putative flippase GtrA
VKTKKRALFFGVIGTIGFLVDVFVFQLIVSALTPYIARIVSFMSAVLVTWVLNRAVTFRDRSSGQSIVSEAWSYAFLMLGGGSLNYLLFVSLVAGIPLVERYPVIGIVAGSLLGMGFNFFSSKRLLFRHPKV